MTFADAETVAGSATWVTVVLTVVSGLFTLAGGWLEYRRRRFIRRIRVLEKREAKCSARMKKLEADRDAAAAEHQQEKEERERAHAAEVEAVQKRAHAYRGLMVQVMRAAGVKYNDMIKILNFYFPGRPTDFLKDLPDLRDLSLPLPKPPPENEP